MLELLDLPPEILANILNYLSGKNLAVVCQVCRKIREVAMVETVWQKRCLIEFNFTTNDGWNATYWDIYTKVLYKYGWLVRLWRRDLDPYGGLVQIKPDGKLELSCLRGYKGPHKCKVTNYDYLKWVSDVKRYNLLPLVVPENNPQFDNIPIKPGFFKGTYSAHGNEILALTYSVEDNEAQLTKITGDPNVPATKVSQHIDFQHTMILTDEQQASMQMLLDIDTHDPSEEELEQAQKQKFILPVQCYCDAKTADIPKFCKLRCHSRGRIAAEGYLNPKFSKSHCIIFDEDNIVIFRSSNLKGDPNVPATKVSFKRKNSSRGIPQSKIQ
ncbi:hypothetical protein KUTeg_020042 [Tegillarca granosa]|uniref:F-box domain-containing protein n=1 Tax=Tegillarca granosa TaxID=220873 RepID=A0ABQ9EGV9_TEGGR|nr:hypothetical protein KUTeg_020042 [Tegillarca granosa]